MGEKVRIEVPKWVASAANIVLWVAAFFAVYWVADLIFRP